VRPAINVLVVGDIVASNTTRLLNSLQEAIPRISVAMTFTVKPHPRWSIDPLNFPALRFKVSTDPLAEILGDFDVAYATSLTSAAVDAYFAGLAVVVMLDPNELNFSPLRGQPAVCFVSTPTELAEALQTCAENPDEHSDVDGFFFLNADLRRWKRLLELNACATG
jgi:surface carbohydrate biosynthesis protein (TIGR04326 family)